MSVHSENEVKCPCGREFSTQLWDAINITEDPFLKDVILNGELNVVQCPACGAIFYVEKLVIYHDIEQSLIIYIYPKDWENRSEELKEKAKRDFSMAIDVFSEKERLIHYRVEVFFGMDRLVEFIHKSNE